MKDVFAVQEEIANSITQRLEVSGDSERQPLFRAGTENLEAFKFYTQGRSLFFQRGVRLLPAVECFKKGSRSGSQLWVGMGRPGGLLQQRRLLWPERT
jgi:hypothetical protein